MLIEVKPDRRGTIESSPAFIGNSKTILLLQFAPQSNSARIINIPADSRVKIPQLGWGTLADANKYGGTALVSQMVKQLLDGITIDRYIRATPATFRQLIASGKITLNSCQEQYLDCNDRAEKFSRQQTVAETIRQRLNIPTYLKSFKTTLIQTKSGLDTNLSIPEAMSIAEFVRELESDRIEVDLVSGYTPGKTIGINSQLDKSQSKLEKPVFLKSASTKKIDRFSNKYDAYKNSPIAIQNTTDSPELGMRVVSYLRGQNFRDVYLVEHIPLKLNRTKIVLNQSQWERAKHLKDIIGFGSLKPKSYARQKPLTIQIGEDARNLLPNNRTY